jgi:hypothetical protein
MVGASNRRHGILSWFRPGPYVQLWCAQGTILLRTGVPVVGRLQARRDRRRGLQVPDGVVGVSSDVVGELWNVCVKRFWAFVSWFPPPPAARGFTFLL